MPLSNDSNESHHDWTPCTWEAFWSRMSEQQWQGDTQGVSLSSRHYTNVQLEVSSPDLFLPLSAFWKISVSAEDLRDTLRGQVVLLRLCLHSNGWIKKNGPELLRYNKLPSPVHQPDFYHYDKTTQGNDFKGEKRLIWAESFRASSSQSGRLVAVWSVARQKHHRGGKLLTLGQPESRESRLQDGSFQRIPQWIY